jgi:tRNA (adenine22-N1)-methyltransferase
MERGKNVQLSRRLQALADMVTPGNVVADVGCDHGFLSIYLVQQGISPRVIAGDVRKGPLSAAGKHIAESGLESYIETRLSDGLAEYHVGEAQTLVCAGMGGKLMQRILMQSREVAMSFRELILQPQSELMQFRIFLREKGFTVCDENILCEDGKYYFMFRVMPRRESTDRNGSGRPDADMGRLGDKYGAMLLERRHPVLREYLEKCLGNCKNIEESLLTHRDDNGGNERIERSLVENSLEIQDLEAALALYAKRKA